MTEHNDQPAVQGGGAQVVDDELPWWVHHHSTLQTLAFALGGTVLGTSSLDLSENAKVVAFLGVCVIWWLSSEGRRLENLYARISDLDSTRLQANSALAIVHELEQVNANLVRLREEHLAEGQRGGLGSTEAPQVDDSLASG